MAQGKMSPIAKGRDRSKAQNITMHRKWMNKNLKTQEERAEAEKAPMHKAANQTMNKNKHMRPESEEHQSDQRNRRKSCMRQPIYHTENGANIVSGVGVGTGHISDAHMNKERYQRWPG